MRWLNWAPEHDSWEAEDNIFDSSLIHAFEMAGSEATRGTTARAPSSAPLSLCPASGSAARAGTPFLGQRVRRCAAGCLEPAQLPSFVPIATAGSSGGSGGAPPTCDCGLPAVRRSKRFWCARADEPIGCDFELWETDGRSRGDYDSDHRPGRSHSHTDAVALAGSCARGEGSPRLPAARQWRAGERVLARYGARQHGLARTTWFAGEVRATHDNDGSCDIAFDDGDFEARVPAGYIKATADGQRGILVSSAAAGGEGEGGGIGGGGGGGGSGGGGPAFPQPLCECGRPAVWTARRWFCARADARGCAFEWSPPPPRPPCALLRRAALELNAARDTAALLTACAHGLNAWCFVAGSDCGLGLWARSGLVAGQALGQYAGPRLPLQLHRRGSYVLQIPGTDVIIDGASENSPYELPRCCAIYANHSSRPNARLELWPVLRPAACEMRQHMVLVASEAITPGAEIRIDYESGNKAKGSSGTYWGAAGMPQQPHESDAWRAARRHPPPPAASAERLVDGLSRLQRAAAASAAAESFDGLLLLLPDEGGAQLPWAGEGGGDARLRVVVPLLARRFTGLKEQKLSSQWASVATHLPGRSGRECCERWAQLAAAAAAAAAGRKGRRAS